jgi:hypothetical protein
VVGEEGGDEVKRLVALGVEQEEVVGLFEPGQVLVGGAEAAEEPGGLGGIDDRIAATLEDQGRGGDVGDARSDGLDEF